MATLLFQCQTANRYRINFELFKCFPDYISFFESVSDLSLDETDFKEGMGQKYYEYNQSLTFLMNHLFYLKWKKENPKKKIDFLCGHSLGEYNALVVAESLDFETALDLIINRNEEMNRIKDGHMMVALGLDRDELNHVLETAHLNEETYLSVCNNTKYHCISYVDSKKTEVLKTLRKHGCHVLSIPFFGPYHSPLMKAAEWEYGWALDEVTFKTPKITVISNYKAIPYVKQDARMNLYNHITKPVQWDKSMSLLKSCGETEFIEMGKNKVLLRQMGVDGRA